MSLFKKTPVQSALRPVENVIYPIEVKFWQNHRQAIIELLGFYDLNELKDGRLTDYLKCKLIPEPENEHDKNAIKVYAGPRGSKTSELLDIGYIPSDMNVSIRTDMKKAVAGTHYWSLRMTFDLIYGLSFELSLRESKFQ